MRGTDTTYNHLRKHTLAAAIGALLIAAGVLFSGTLSSNAAGETLGVDADTTGNDAATVGTRQDCREVSVGQDFYVDVFITGAANLQAWDAYLNFDPSRLALTAFSTTYMLPQFDASFDFQNGVLYLASAKPAGATGSGVLARLSFHANASGFSPVSISTAPPYGPHLGNDPFTGPVLNAQIAIDQACSGAPTPAPTLVTTPTPTPSPSPTPTSTVGGNTSTPTPTPSFTPVPGSIPWGDINCANGVTIADAIYIAMLKVGLAVSPIGSPCPEVGDQLIGAPIAVNWGDFDCSQQFDLGDAIHILRYLIGLTGGIGGCPLVATNYVSFP